MLYCTHTHMNRPCTPAYTLLCVCKGWEFPLHTQSNPACKSRSMPQNPAHGKQSAPPSAAKCGYAVTHQDVSRTCNTLPTGKSPGPDRIPNKFYKTFSAVIAPILANVIHESHEKGEFTPSFSDASSHSYIRKRKRRPPKLLTNHITKRGLQNHDAYPNTTHE